jgi:hypothetical protein
MKEHKEYFKQACSEFIWWMINNQDVNYKTFFYCVETIELMMDNFVVDIDNNANCLLQYHDILKAYIAKLDRLKHSFNYS